MALSQPRATHRIEDAPDGKAARDVAELSDTEFDVGPLAGEGAEPHHRQQQRPSGVGKSARHAFRRTSSLINRLVSCTLSSAAENRVG